VYRVGSEQRCEGRSRKKSQMRFIGTIEREDSSHIVRDLDDDDTLHCQTLKRRGNQTLRVREMLEHMRQHYDVVASFRELRALYGFGKLD
jgi:hypothetical protein